MRGGDDGTGVPETERSAFQQPLILSLSKGEGRLAFARLPLPPIRRQAQGRRLVLHRSGCGSAEAWVLGSSPRMTRWRGAGAFCNAGRCRCGGRRAASVAALP